MPYRLCSDEPLGEGLRRIAVEQVQGGLESLLAVRSRGDPDAVHDFRKRTKKIRAVAKLVRPVVGDSRYRAVNTAARDAARRLSATRDAQVLAESLEELLAWAGASSAVSVDRRQFAGARRAASRRVAEASERAAGELADDADHAEVLLTEARGHIELWDLPEVPKTFAGGLQRAHRRGRRRMAEARRDPGAENIHEWRKRAKERWYQTRILAPVAPRLAEAESDALDDLGEALGQHRDLALLMAAMEADPQSWGGEQRCRTLAGLASIRQGELAAAAFDLGRQLCAEKPRAATRRWVAWWSGWSGY